MQTTKARPSALEVTQETSPAASRTARKLKTQALDSETTPSPKSLSKMPKDRSPKVVDRRSPRSPATERKRPTKTVELETQVAQLQEELKKAKNQLSSSESLKKRAEQDAEEAKKQVGAMLIKLEDSKKQLQELSDMEESRLQELLQNSQERDRAWKSELEAVQKHHSLDSAALASAMMEIQKLKTELNNRVAESKAKEEEESAAQVEIRNLRLELEDTVAEVEWLKSQLSDSRECEADAVEEASRAQVQLTVAKTVEETMLSESQRVKEAYESLVFELEKSKSQVHSLEETVNQLQANLHQNSMQSSSTGEENHVKDEETVKQLQEVKNEAIQLRDALAASEKRFEDEYIQSTLEIKVAYELIEQTKSESYQREAELEATLTSARIELEELKSKLNNNNQEYNSGFNETHKGTSTELEQLETGVQNDLPLLEDLKASLLDKETELQGLMEENEMLKSEMMNLQDTERKKSNDEARAVADATRNAEQEVLLKLGYLTEEANKNSFKAIQVTEKLDATQAASYEIEAELKRLKVHADQWRKAAEAATAMLSTGGNTNNNNGKYVERTGSMDYHTLGGKLNAPYPEDFDDESPKKKNGNMLKKIGVLLKKGQK